MAVNNPQAKAIAEQNAKAAQSTKAANNPQARAIAEQNAGTQKIVESNPSLKQTAPEKAVPVQTQSVPAPAAPQKTANNPQAQEIARQNAQTPSVPAPSAPAVQQPQAQPQAPQQDTSGKVAFGEDAVALQQVNPEYIAQRNKNIVTNLQPQISAYMTQGEIIDDTKLQGLAIDYIQQNPNYVVDMNSKDWQNTINNIVNNLKQTPEYNLAKQRNAEYQQYTTMGVDGLSMKMKAGELVPGTQLWNKLLATRPADMAAAQGQKSLSLKQDIMGYLLGNIDPSKSLASQVSPMTLFGAALGLLTNDRAPSNLAAQYKDAIQNDPQISELRTQNKDLLDKLNAKKRDIEYLREDIQAQITAGGGVATSAYLSALAAEKSKPLIREYEAYVDQYNANQGALKDLLDEKKTILQFAAQDEQLNMQQDAQQLNKLGFLANLYDTFTKDEREIEKQKQLLQIQYDFNNPDMNSPDPAVQSRALSMSLDKYYEQYSSIIKRPKAQVVNDVKAYAKQKGISLAEALQENFVKPLQEKPEYKLMLQKAMGIDTKPFELAGQTWVQNPDGSYSMKEVQNIANMSGAELFATLRSGKYNDNKFFGVYATGDATGQRGAALYEDAVANGLDNFLAKYKGSPITMDMIQIASQQYGIEPEMIAATMALDSSMGTKGKAVRTKNPGNVGNTDSGAERTYASWQDGVNAVAKNLRARADALSKVAGVGSVNSEVSEIAKQIIDGKTTSIDLKRAGYTEAQLKAIEQEKQRLVSEGYTPSKRITDPAQLFSFEQSLAKQFTSEDAANKEVRKQVSIINNSFGSIDPNSKKSLNAASQGILVTFQKILDPESVVRETEYARSAEGISLINQMQGKFERISQGGAGVPYGELKELVSLANTFAEGYNKSTLDTANRIKKAVDTYGLDINNVLPGSVVNMLSSGSNPITTSIYDSLKQSYSAGGMSQNTMLPAIQYDGYTIDLSQLLY